MWCTRVLLALAVLLLGGCEALSNRLFGEAGERVTRIGYQAEDRGDDLYSVHGIGDDVWAVGGWGAILHSDDGGETWAPQRSAVIESLLAVRFAARNQGWAVGKGGIILQTLNAGEAWQPQQSFSEHDLLAVWPVDGQRVWAAGDLGVRLYTENGGGRWLDRSLGRDTIINDIVFFDEHRGVMAGEFRTVSMTDDGGKTWRQLADIEEVSDDMNFFAAAFMGRDQLFLSGIGGTLLRSSDAGATWARIPYPDPTDALFGLAQAGDGALVASGGYGTLTRIEIAANHGAHPVEMPEANGFIRDLHFADAQRGWAVGERGLIMKTTDGGRKWRRVH